MILHEKTNAEFGYTFDTATVGKDIYCQCDYCGQEFLRTKRALNRGKRHNPKHCCNDKSCIKAKKEETNLEKYGNIHYGGSEECWECLTKESTLESASREN